MDQRTLSLLLVGGTEDGGLPINLHIRREHPEALNEDLLLQLTQSHRLGVADESEFAGGAARADEAVAIGRRWAAWGEEASEAGGLTVQEDGANRLKDRGNSSISTSHEIGRGLRRSRVLQTNVCVAASSFQASVKDLYIYIYGGYNS